jgi:hypothetical protein
LRGVSSFLNEAARDRLARLKLRGLLDELDAKHGKAPEAVRVEIARATLADPPVSVRAV